MFTSIYTAVITNIQKYSGKGSGWIIDSVIDHNISISKYNPLAGSSYIKLSKELDHPRKGLINIQNTDNNECFKWCLFRHLNPSDHYPTRITNGDEDFAKRRDFKDMKCLGKTRDIYKIKKRILLALAFLVMERRCLRKNISISYSFYAQGIYIFVHSVISKGTFIVQNNI